jgi:Zn2+/Cd2+-exporting ATPase
MTGTKEDQITQERSVSAFGPQLLFDLEGIDCADCARTVERRVQQLPEVTSATVNFGAATLQVRTESRRDLTSAVQDAVDAAGYHAEPRKAGAAVEDVPSPWWRDRRLLGPGVGALLWVGGLTSTIAGASDLVVIGLYGAGLLVAAKTFLRASLQSFRARRVDMNILMTIAVAGAVLLGEWSEASLAAILFAIGNVAQALSLDRTRGAVKDLLVLTPAEASRLRSGAEEQVPLEAIRPGDLVRVRPGERIPIDGRVISGMSDVEQAAVTGESMPMSKSSGDEVFAGTLNGTGALLVEATRPASDSTLARIVHAVEEAQGSRAPVQQVVDRFASIYTPLVVVGAVLLAVGGSYWTGDARTWATRALVLLVVSCPCALIISTPVAIVTAIGAAAKRGVIVKGGAALEAIGRTKAVAFDKTGTLTTGRPRVSALVAYGPYGEDDLLRLAAGVEQHSEHPLGRAIVQEAFARELSLPEALDLTAHVGHGVQAQVEGRTMMVGSVRWAESLLPAAMHGAIRNEAQRLGQRGQTPLFVLGDGPGETSEIELVGAIGISDRTRPDAAIAVQELRARGIAHVAMLTGDTLATASAIGRSAGIDDVRAEQLPSDKLDALRQLEEAYGPVAMVGDGINDAPAMAAAGTAIAMGRGGTDVALDVAQVALLRNDLLAVPGVIDLSRRTTQIIRQNIGLSLVVKAIALTLGVVGIANLWIAVAADMGTSLIVTANALRLLRWSPSEPASHRDHGVETATSVAVAGPAPVSGGDGSNGSFNSEYS